MKTNLILASLAGILGVSAAAHGAIISTPYTFPNTQIGLGLSVPVAPFDTTLGTLTSVEIITSGASKATVAFFNLSGIATPFTNASTSGTVTLAGPGVSDPAFVSFGGLTGVVSSAVGASYFVDPGAGSSMPGDFLFNSPTIPAAYTGASPIPFTINSSTFTTGGSFDSHNFTLFIGGDATTDTVALNVIYTFSPIPEPASLALLGLGTAGLLARRRRA